MSKMKVTKITFFIAGLLLLLCSCDKAVSQKSLELERDALMRKVQEISYDIVALKLDFSNEKCDQVMSELDKIHLTTPIEEVPEPLRMFYLKTQHQMDSMVAERRGELEHLIFSKIHPHIVKSDELVVKPGTEFPIYLVKGDTLFINFSTNNTMNATLYNMDSKTVVKEYGSVNRINDKRVIRNTAVYSLVLRSEQTQYISIEIGKKSSSFDNLWTSMKVEMDTIEAVASDFMSVRYQTIKLQNLFEEPRRLSLRSAIKSAFSGSSRSIVALQLPENTNDLAYQLRISTSKSDDSCDGQFFENSRSAYRKVRLLGLPVYESAKNNTSILREILNRVSPPRKEEDAYCDLYVFKSESQAKQFQNGAAVEKLNYDINNCIIGTQSCNNRIPINGERCIYLGLLNGHTATDVYIWIEAFVTIPTTAYHKMSYKAEARKQ